MGEIFDKLVNESEDLTQQEKETLLKIHSLKRTKSIVVVCAVIVGVFAIYSAIKAYFNIYRGTLLDTSVPGLLLSLFLWAGIFFIEYFLIKK